MSYSNLIGKGAEMERLTDKNIVGKHFYPKCFEKCDGFGASSKCNNCEIMTSICEKLGEYEDLEEQGRLVKLPCKVGTAIYYILGIPNETPCTIDNCTFKLSDINKIGKTLFLTREKAEERLKELRGEENE